MKNFLLKAIFLFLFVFGFEKTILAINASPMGYKELIVLFLGIFVLLIYLIPFLFATNYLEKKLDSENKVFLIAFISGAFIATVFSSFANEGLENLWANFLKKETLEMWSAALTGPFSEEIIKGLVALLTLSLFKNKKIKDYLFAGIGSGLGFQFMEDISYMLPKASDIESLNSSIAQALDRLSSCLASHWTYSAIFLVGIYFLAKTKKRKKGLFFLLIPVVLHFIWNSPISDTNGPFTPISPTLTAITLGVFIMALKEVFNITKEEKTDNESVNIPDNNLIEA